MNYNEYEPTPEQKRKMREIGQKFRKQMQKIVDSGGCDSISVSSPSMRDGKEIIIAQKKRAG